MSGHNSSRSEVGDDRPVESSNSHAMARQGEEQTPSGVSAHDQDIFFRTLYTVLTRFQPPAISTPIMNVAKELKGLGTPEFKGEVEEGYVAADLWLNDVKIMLDGLHCSDVEKLDGVVSLLRGQARIWWTNVILRMTKNYLIGHLPQQVCPGGALEIFVALNNYLKGPVPLKNCTTLRRVRLEHNQLTGNVSEDLGIYTNLDYLDLSHNKLIGELSPKWGSIPPEIGLLSDLSLLNLAVNSFNGSIPRWLWKCKTLLELNLSVNRLSGAMPSEVGNLSFLQVLDLSQNLLIGKKPDQVGNLKSLQKLNLSRNKLSSVIPSTLDDIVSLTSVDISENQLQGPLPHNEAFQEASFEAFRNNKGLCGNVTGLEPCSTNLNHDPDQKKNSKIVIATLVPILLTLLLILVVARILLFSRPKERNTESMPRIKQLKNLTPNTALELGDMEAFTRHNCLMVKWLLLPEGGLENQKALYSEIQALTEIRHRNILKLQGFCSHLRHSLLVYELLEGGNLEKILKTDEQEAKFDWKLEYEAHVADFGAARLLKPDSSNWTSFEGSFSYAAPGVLHRLKSIMLIIRSKLMSFTTERSVRRATSISEEPNSNGSCVSIVKLASLCLHANPARPRMQQVS
ncbi:hypothetical protein F3Y22_tig00116975pilonHSYRG00168 [Hibiscus syriacus]|uniref:non-specific serine/threonine protein kinase n=1 Tax=Hibiscus syriacus TaxID=106335 RepID=A0A6A2WIF8_HIBSY|nr:hypothetical protein F3Y22_tig00116975pilonHSYRG00168 [Hibiscus syriacus]